MISFLVGIFSIPIHIKKSSIQLNAYFVSIYLHDKRNTKQDKLLALVFDCLHAILI